MNLLFTNPDILSLLPFVLIGVFLLCYYPWRKPRPTRIRRIIFSIYMCVLIAGIVIAIAQPFVITQTDIEVNPPIQVIFDESASMSMYRLGLEDITNQLEGVLPYETQVIGDDQQTPLLATLIANMKANTDILLVTDGQDTNDDLTYEDVYLKAQEINARVHLVNLTSSKDERSIYLDGPQTTVTGIDNTYAIKLSGEGQVRQVTVFKDGETVFNEPNQGTFSVRYEEEGTYTYLAQIETERDGDIRNNKFYKTTRVIPKPPVLYVGNDDEMVEFLQQFTDVTVFEQIPKDIEPYTAIILQNQDSANLDNAEQLIDYVSLGNGLVVLGGDNAYEFSNYDSSALSTLLPVLQGKSGDLNRAAVAIVVDISASSGSSEIVGFTEFDVSEVIQILSYDLVNSLPADSLVTVVGYYQVPHLIQKLDTLGPNRQSINDKISRLRFDGAGTQVHQGLQAAWNILDAVSGAKSIILISDGGTGGGGDGAKAIETATQLGRAGIPVYAIGVSSEARMGTLRTVADRSNGLALLADQRSRLNTVLDVSQIEEDYVSPKLTLQIEDQSHPITRGITNIDTVLSGVNYVIPKQFADTLAKTSNGDPAIVAWRYGLGRVVSMTAFTGTQQLGNLLAAPDSRLLARVVSYAIGDPEKKQPPSIRIDDTTIGKPARVTATGPLPNDLGIVFNSIDERLHTSSIFPNETGIQEQFGATYAVSYQEELRLLTINPRLEALMEATGGASYNENDVAQIQNNILDLTNVQEENALYLFQAVLAVLVLMFFIVLMIRKIEEKRI